MFAVRIAAMAAIAAVAAQGTTLVAVWSPNQLLLAADSSVTQTARGLRVQGSACKIGQHDTSYFALSGLVEDLGIQYQAASLAQDAVAAGGPLEQQLAHFIELATPQISRSLAQMKKDAPDQYEYLCQGHPALQAIFANVEEGPPSLAVVAIGVAPDGTLRPSSQVIARGDDGRGPRIIYAGQQSRIREYLRDHRDWYRGEQTELVRNLLRLEIASSNGEVGGPVDILKLTPKAAEWVQRKPGCE